jgi:hypothetical protein
VGVPLPLPLGSVPLLLFGLLAVLFLGLITVKYTGTTTAVAISATAAAARTHMRGFLWKGFDFEFEPSPAKYFSPTSGSRGAELEPALLKAYDSRGVDTPSEGARYVAAGGRRGSWKVG